MSCPIHHPETAGCHDVKLNHGWHLWLRDVFPREGSCEWVGTEQFMLRMCVLEDNHFMRSKQPRTEMSKEQYAVASRNIGSVLAAVEKHGRQVWLTGVVTGPPGDVVYITDKASRTWWMSSRYLPVLRELCFYDEAWMTGKGAPVAALVLFLNGEARAIIADVHQADLTCKCGTLLDAAKIRYTKEAWAGDRIKEPERSKWATDGHMILRRDAILRRTLNLIDSGWSSRKNTAADAERVVTDAENGAVRLRVIGWNEFDPGGLVVAEYVGFDGIVVVAAKTYAFVMNSFSKGSSIGLWSRPGKDLSGSPVVIRKNGDTVGVMCRVGLKAKTYFKIKQALNATKSQARRLEGKR